VEFCLIARMEKRLTGAVVGLSKHDLI
jgi:hypothetical protein